jgi:hypothetical protein
MDNSTPIFSEKKLQRTKEGVRNKKNVSVTRDLNSAPLMDMNDWPDKYASSSAKDKNVDDSLYFSSMLSNIHINTTSNMIWCSNPLDQAGDKISSSLPPANRTTTGGFLLRTKASPPWPCFESSKGGYEENKSNFSGFAYDGPSSRRISIPPDPPKSSYSFDLPWSNISTNDFSELGDLPTASFLVSECFEEDADSEAVTCKMNYFDTSVFNKNFDNSKNLTGTKNSSGFSNDRPSSNPSEGFEEDDTAVVSKMNYSDTSVEKEIFDDSKNLTSENLGFIAHDGPSSRRMSLPTCWPPQTGLDVLPVPNMSLSKKAKSALSTVPFSQINVSKTYDDETSISLDLYKTEEFSTNGLNDPEEILKNFTCSIAEDAKKELVTAFAYAIMCQLVVAEFSECDRRGNRSCIPVGFKGVQCRFCKGNGSQRTGRYFATSLKSFGDNLKTIFPIHRHLLTCPKCPADVNLKINRLFEYHFEELEMKKRLRGGQRRFYRHIWNSLHPMNPMNKSMNGHRRQSI